MSLNSLSTRARLWLVFCLSSLFLMGTALFARVTQLVPCLLCNCQRGCLWGAAFFGCFSLIFFHRKRPFVLFLTLLKISLFSLFCFAIFHALTHMGKVPDVCIRNPANFVSEKDYLNYLASHPPCGQNVATLMGIPLYLFTFAWGGIGFLLLSSPKNAVHTLALFGCFFLPLKGQAVSLESCLQGGCLANAQIDLQEEDRLLLFVSFSLPDTVLKSFSRELEKYGGTFVLRGIPNNSFTDLFKKIKSLQDQGIYTPFEIDPDLFDEVVSNKVPTLALIGDKAKDRIVGNLSIRASLEKIANEGDNKALAKKRLKRKNAW